MADTTAQLPPDAAWVHTPTDPRHVQAAENLAFVRDFVPASAVPSNCALVPQDGAPPRALARVPDRVPLPVPGLREEVAVRGRAAQLLFVDATQRALRREREWPRLAASLERALSLRPEVSEVVQGKDDARWADHAKCAMVFLVLGLTVAARVESTAATAHVGYALSTAHGPSVLRKAGQFAASALGSGLAKAGRFAGRNASLAVSNTASSAYDLMKEIGTSTEKAARRQDRAFERDRASLTRSQAPRPDVVSYQGASDRRVSAGTREDPIELLSSDEEGPSGQGGGTREDPIELLSSSDEEGPSGQGTAKDPYVL